MDELDPNILIRIVTYTTYESSRITMLVNRHYYNNIKMFETQDIYWKLLSGNILICSEWDYNIWNCKHKYSKHIRIKSYFESKFNVSFDDPEFIDALKIITKARTPIESLTNNPIVLNILYYVNEAYRVPTLEYIMNNRLINEGKDCLCYCEPLKWIYQLIDDDIYFSLFIFKFCCKVMIMNARKKDEKYNKVVKKVAKKVKSEF